MKAILPDVEWRDCYQDKRIRERAVRNKVSMKRKEKISVKEGDEDEYIQDVSIGGLCIRRDESPILCRNMLRMLILGQQTL